MREETRWHSHEQGRAGSLNDVCPNERQARGEVRVINKLTGENCLNYPNKEDS